MFACLLSVVGSLLAVYVYYVYFVTGYLWLGLIAGYVLGLLFSGVGFGFPLRTWVCYWIVYCCLVIYYILFYFITLTCFGLGNFGVTSGFRADLGGFGVFAVVS